MKCLVLLYSPFSVLLHKKKSDIMLFAYLNYFVSFTLNFTRDDRSLCLYSIWDLQEGHKYSAEASYPHITLYMEFSKVNRESSPVLNASRLIISPEYSFKKERKPSNTYCK